MKEARFHDLFDSQFNQFHRFVIKDKIPYRYIFVKKTKNLSYGNLDFISIFLKRDRGYVAWKRVCVCLHKKWLHNENLMWCSFRDMKRFFLLEFMNYNEADRDSRQLEGPNDICEKVETHLSIWNPVLNVNVKSRIRKWRRWRSFCVWV